MSRSAERVLIERGGLLALATLVIYAWIAPPHIIFGDNAEFSALGVVGGVAHPSGYPLYVLWLRAWSWLPVDTPAHAAALATVVLTVLEVLVLQAACRAWGARSAAATIATALFVASPLVIRIQATAEVFALNGLVAATVIWLAAATGPFVARRRVFVLCLVAGLGLSNHLTCVLVAPIGILGVARGLRESETAKASGVALGLLGFVLGLSPYLYLVLAPDSPMSWRAMHGLGDVVHHFLRADYGTGQLSGRGGALDPIAHLAALARSIGRAYLWVPAAAGLGALVYFAVHRGRGESRAAWITYAATFVLAGPLFVSMFNINPHGVGLYTVQRLHALPVLLASVPVAVMLDRVLDRVRIPEGLQRSRVVSGTVMMVAFTAAVGLSLPAVSRAHSPAAERALDNMLRTLPDQAVVIGSTDEFHFGMGYLQYALNERPDVVTIALPQVGLPDYRERIRQRLGFTIENAAVGEKLSVKIAEQVLATGRPLFIDPYQANIASSFPTYSYGVLFRVLPRDATPPPIEEVFALNKDVFGRYRLDYAVPGTDDVLATQYHFLYARMWTMLANALARSGRRGDAQVAHDMAEALAPR